MAVLSKAEFKVADAYQYDHSSPIRWILSHILRYWYLFFGTAFAFLVASAAGTYSRYLFGVAANAIFNPTVAALPIGLTILGLQLLSGVAAFVAAMLNEVSATRLQTNTREEFYTALLGKSQTFHDRQSTGDLMARASDDTLELNRLIAPGLEFVFIDITLGFIMPMIFIATIDLQLLVIPIVFVGAYAFLVSRYTDRLGPVVGEQRGQFGKMNGGLEETISGIEVVKASSQEMFERFKFRRNASKFRDLYVKQGQIEATYLPFLAFSVAYGMMFAHVMILERMGWVGMNEVISFMALAAALRFPVFISSFGITLIQLGIASAARILAVIKEETELDENSGGHRATMQGHIRFEQVAFAFDERSQVLNDISFEVQAGQTVAIVGQTGSGKTTLTELVNRTYDVTAGRILIDGIDIKEWNLDALRSQISKIEQDVFLFSRTLAENIAFSNPTATQADIERAAREAQADEFIRSFKEGYETKVGERGITLSGGQRQRIALARAFMSDPRILILDDSTSAIDSATEDQIQKAIKRAQQGRTVLLITHRLSQIRWADRIILLESGKIAAQGTHDELLQTSTAYRRIFARYMTELPPLVAETN